MALVHLLQPINGHIYTSPLSYETREITSRRRPSFKVQAFPSKTQVLHSSHMGLFFNWCLCNNCVYIIISEENHGGHFSKFRWSWWRRWVLLIRRLEEAWQTLVNYLQLQIRFLLIIDCDYFFSLRISKYYSWFIVVVEEPQRVVSTVPGSSDVAEKVVDNFDVIVCGGTLGIFVATALCSKGLRVAVVERNALKGVNFKGKRFLRALVYEHLSLG